MQVLSPSALMRAGLLAVLVASFGLINDSFLSAGNVYALGQSFALIGLVALGLSLTMIAGEFDLSLGATVAIAALLMVKTGESHPLWGVAVAVGVGVLIGLVNAALVLKLNVSSLVTTLGVMILLRGVAVWIEGGQVAAYGNFDAADWLDATLLKVLSPRSVITIACFVAAALLLRCTRVGRDLIACGSQRKAAVMSGARVPLTIVVAFSVCGGLAGLAGALMAISLASASAQFGSNLLLQAATAAILGGVALSGGVGRPGGVAVGVLILAVLNNGLSLIGAGSAAILLFNGGVLLAVVLIEGSLPGMLRRAWLQRGAGAPRHGRHAVPVR